MLDPMYFLSECKLNANGSFGHKAAVLLTVISSRKDLIPILNI